MDKIKAIIFDWGGVLIEDPAPGIVQYCSAVLGVSEEEFVTARERHLPDFDRGFISETIFWQRLTKELQVAPPKKMTLWGEAFRRVYTPRPQVFSWVENLQASGYITGLLSNTEPPNMKYFLQQKYSMFAATTFSCAEGVRKPDPIIYQRALKKAGVTPQEAIYLDDKQAYAEAASQLGIHGYMVKTVHDISEVLASHQLNFT